MKDHLRNVHKINKENVVEVPQQIPDETPSWSSVAPRQASVIESFKNISEQVKKQKN